METKASTNRSELLQELLQASQKDAAGLTEDEFEMLTQAFRHYEKQMFKEKRVVNLYPNWVTGEEIKEAS